MTMRAVTDEAGLSVEPYTPSKSLIPIPQSVIAAAQAADKATGIPASTTIAQWAVESQCTGTFNYFGIKAVEAKRARRCRYCEVIDGQRIAVTANFANYASLPDAFTLHAPARR